MRNVNTNDLLIDRAKLFEGHFGCSGTFEQGKVSFPCRENTCLLTLHSRRSIMSINHFLSLQASVGAEEEGRQAAVCYLNRFGKWSTRGRNPMMRRLCALLNSSVEVSSELRGADLDSVVIRDTGTHITLEVNLYGGGYSVIVLPPLQFRVGLSGEQARKAATLFTSVHTLIQEFAA